MGNLAFNNIVKIHDETKINETIDLFMNMELSKSTRDAYRTDITRFFGVYSLNQITGDMIKKVDYIYAGKYFNKMKETFASNSVARHLSSVKALFNYINNCDTKDINGDSLINGKNPLNTVKAPIEKNERGSFTYEESMNIISIASFDDGVFYELCGKTSVRKEAVRKLNIIYTKYNNSFIKIDGVWCIHGFDKGMHGIDKEFTVAIGEELYDNCKKLASSNPNGKVFTFSENTPLNRLRGSRGKTEEDNIRNYKKGYCYRVGISKEEYDDRKLCVHSLKKTGGQIVNDLTNGNVSKIMQQCKDGIKYTMETYQKRGYNPHTDPSNLIELRGKENKNELNDRLKNRSEYELREIILGLDKGIRDNILGMLVSEFGDIDSRISENGRVDHRLAEM